MQIFNRFCRFLTAFVDFDDQFCKFLTDVVKTLDISSKVCKISLYSNLKEVSSMTKTAKSFYGIILRAIPVCTAVMMTLSVNAAATWIKGQEKLPANAKRYRKF